jgi:AcrR family transcriptional regulator
MALGGGRLSRARIAEIQRDRMLAAAVDAIEEIGYARLSVGAVISRARVSRKTFYDVFANREDCFLAVFEQTLSQAGLLAREAYARESNWRQGIRGALSIVLAYAEEEPALARLLVVEALRAGDGVSRRRAQALAEIADVIDQGRHAANVVTELPEISAEGIVGAVFAVLHARLLNGAREGLTDLLGPLMYLIVLPYLGPRAARRELNRPTTLARRERDVWSPVRSHSAFDGLRMRLTYRTSMVLAAIAEHPGASNREIAESAGVVDQGQISKLLHRLAGLELVENYGAGQESGAPNAWRLTQRGNEVTRAACLR